MKRLENKEWLEYKYVKCELSMQCIADEIGTSRQKVRRALIKHEIPIRDRSEAQKTALGSGRTKHPTKGKKRTEKEKRNIAVGVSNSWNNEAKKKKRSKQSKNMWKNMSSEKKEKIMKAARNGVRIASKDGSKSEKAIRDILTRSGYIVQYHMKGAIQNLNLEVDMFLPELSIAIEVDGPSHFFPIWGEDSLQKNIKADLEKNGLLLSRGVIVVRVKQTDNNISNLRRQNMSEKVLDVIKQIEQEPPTEKNRLIEIEA